MINLLPPHVKARAKSETRFRLVLVLGVSLGIGVLALILFLIVIDTALKTERSAQEITLSSFKEQILKEDSALGEIRSWNSRLLNIEAFKKERQKMTEVLDQVSEALPPELYLLTFSFTPAFETTKKDDVVVKTPATIALTGRAETREHLLAFKDILQANPFFSEVSFPPSNWVTPANITFSFQAKLESQP